MPVWVGRNRGKILITGHEAVSENDRQIIVANLSLNFKEMSDFQAAFLIRTVASEEANWHLVKRVPQQGEPTQLNAA